MCPEECPKTSWLASSDDVTSCLVVSVMWRKVVCCPFTFRRKALAGGVVGKRKEALQRNRDML